MKLLFTAILILYLSLITSHGESNGLIYLQTFSTYVDRSGDECECTDPRFKAAERDAYQELVQERSVATKELTDELSQLEAEFKVALEIRNRNLQKALNECKDIKCTEGTREENLKFLKDNEAGRQGSLEKAQDKEARLFEEAQDKFDKLVKEAREQFCSDSCCGGWTGTITYTKTTNSSIKHTVLPHKSPMAITEGGNDDSETTETYSGTVFLDGKSEAKTERVFRTSSDGTHNYDFIFTNNNSIFGQVWCSPLQGFKGSHGVGSQVRYASGTGNNPTSVIINLDSNNYSIYITPPPVVIKSENSSQNSSANACQNNKPINNTGHSNNTGSVGAGALSSLKKPYGADRNVLSDSSTVTIESPPASLSEATSTTSSTKSVVTTITWNLRRCN
jgi:hypothetical protein